MTTPPSDPSELQQAEPESAQLIAVDAPIDTQVAADSAVTVVEPVVEPVVEAEVEPAAKAVVEPAAEAVVEPAAEAVVEPVVEAAVEAVAPSSSPVPSPTPRRVPAPAPAPTTESAPAPGPSPSLAFGRADADGTVWLLSPEGEIRVGHYAAGTPDEGLAFYARKYDDLAVEASLSLRRLRDGRATPESAVAVAAKVREALVDPGFVGDLVALRSTCDQIDTQVEVQRARRSAQKAAAKAAAIAAREKLVAEAESLAASTQWKPTGERFRELLDEWKVLPHGDRASEQSLWKRFSTARSAFDKARRTHFAKLEVERSAAKTAKLALIGEAEQLATSTEWGPTSNAFRSLIDRWKAAPKGPRKDEDAWWARFKAAQDSFFTARTTVTNERDVELRGNLEVKQALLAEAQALLPITDAEAAARSLRSIQQRWEAVGHVPRGDQDRIDGGLRKVEEALRTAEGERWRRTDPAKRAFAESTVEKFEQSVSKLEKARVRAEASGDTAAAAQASASIEGIRPLLEAAQKSLAEYS
ncbi:MAG: DUF349 domain-containing protein [Actinobacteria bacterium]|uniref:Unannotated protein n=1 Tax=freshwater metagenome TaxID=449393 RepID=A0A6J7KXB8_9ZZZZ|nr:DUF349 domain-containing protein [Actinomycetota bacterium]